MYVKTCERCQRQFEAKVANKRFCGLECFSGHRKEYGRQNIESRKVDRTCRQCGGTYRRVYEKSGFCSISCGSKWNIEHGVSDAWRLKSQPKQGFTVPCAVCSVPVYVTARFRDNPPKKVCGPKCESEHRSRVATGNNNPMFGRKNSEESLAKSKRTLLQNHGVTNAFFLSKHRTVSKAQKEILDHLTSNVPQAKFEGEKLFHSGTHRYFVDIFSANAKMVVEFNGDYWHCNPSLYSGSFIHPRKNKAAEQIWREDLERMRVLQEMGYHTVTVWESEYNSDRQGVLQKLTKSALSCSKRDASG